MYYVTLDEVDTHIANDPYTYTQWSAFSDTVKAQYIERAEWIIDRDFKFVGYPMNRTQVHAFPRDFTKWIPVELDNFYLVGENYVIDDKTYYDPLVIYNQQKDIPMVKDSVMEIVIELVKNSSLSQLKDLQNSVGAVSVSIASIKIDMTLGSRIGQAVRSYLRDFLMINFSLRN
jgi:hypothetical protein